MSFINDRRRVLQAGAALAASTTLPAFAQDLSKPLRIIVPLPAGGVADNSVRIFADQWTAQTKQAVTVDNRPGGSYIIGMQQIIAAPADGNTWIHLNSEMTAAQATFQRYDLNRQLAMIGLGGSTPGAIFVSESSPWRSVKELTDWIRANPNKLSYGAVVGGAGHLHAANFLRKQNLTGTVIAFKGGPDSMTALAQGELQMCMTALPLIIPFKGKVRALAVMTDQRSALAPEVPTYKELGLDLPELDYWGGFAVPAGTPAATIASINRTMNDVLKHPNVTTKYVAQGMVAKGSSSEALTRMITEDLRWMTPYANELNLRAG